MFSLYNEFGSDQLILFKMACLISTLNLTDEFLEVIEMMKKPNQLNII